MSAIESSRRCSFLPTSAALPVHVDKAIILVTPNQRATDQDLLSYYQYRFKYRQIALIHILGWDFATEVRTAIPAKELTSRSIVILRAHQVGFEYSGSTIFSAFPQASLPLSFSGLTPALRLAPNPHFSQPPIQVAKQDSIPVREKTSTITQKYIDKILCSMADTEYGKNILKYIHFSLENKTWQFNTTVCSSTLHTDYIAHCETNSLKYIQFKNFRKYLEACLPCIETFNGQRKKNYHIIPSLETCLAQFNQSCKKILSCSLHIHFLPGLSRKRKWQPSNGRSTPECHDLIN
jgi:hypothetical protein